MAELPKLSGTEILGGAAVIGGIAALGVTAAVIRHHKKSKKRKISHKNRKSSSSRSKKKKLKFGSKAYRKRYLKHGRRQKQPYTAGKRIDTSHRRIRYTKNNQPYIIQGDGRARFISKRSVSSSRKREGGKY